MRRGTNRSTPRGFFFRWRIDKIREAFSRLHRIPDELPDGNRAAEETEDHADQDGLAIEQRIDPDELGEIRGDQPRRDRDQVVYRRGGGGPSEHPLHDTLAHNRCAYDPPRRPQELHRLHRLALGINCQPDRIGDQENRRDSNHHSQSEPDGVKGLRLPVDELQHLPAVDHVGYAGNPGDSLLQRIRLLRRPEAVFQEYLEGGRQRVELKDFADFLAEFLLEDFCRIILGDELYAFHAFRREQSRLDLVDLPARNGLREKRLHFHALADPFDDPGGIY